MDDLVRSTLVKVGDVRVAANGQGFRVVGMNGAKTWCVIQNIDAKKKQREVTTAYVERCRRAWRAEP